MGPCSRRSAACASVCHASSNDEALQPEENTVRYRLHEHAPEYCSNLHNHPWRRDSGFGPGPSLGPASDHLRNIHGFLIHTVFLGLHTYVLPTTIPRHTLRNAYRSVSFILKHSQLQLRAFALGRCWGLDILRRRCLDRAQSFINVSAPQENTAPISFTPNHPATDPWWLSLPVSTLTDATQRMDP